ncbi:ribonuclease HII [bacterium]|nr:ribonuclease HII [candidate division CSSED10-310 bacterium]
MKPVSDAANPLIANVHQYEQLAARSGYCAVAGLDEAGRGALCGPVVAAAVILFHEQFIDEVDDSKRLTPRQRSRAYDRIRTHARAVGVGLARADEIDRINILEATRLAMQRAIGRLRITPDYLLLDAVRLEAVAIPQLPIIKGDRLSHSIAAASIIAKVIRDRIMRVWNRTYPQYGWANNMGYGTEEHLMALRRHGPSPIHRRTFRGVLDCRGLFDPV